MLNLIDVLTLISCAALIIVSWPFFRRSVRLLEFIEEHGLRSVGTWPDDEFENYMEGK
tara:strand:+ start:536 stop:709 length:174 start_codon:yes stop_codon:yes gene_type:complete